MFKSKDKTKQMGLHQARVPSAQMGSQAGQPPSKNPQPKPQPPKRMAATADESPANKTAPYSPKARC